VVPEGFGTALKPASEPICVARKPLSAKTVAANVLEHGTGALNIDACRIAASANDPNARNSAGHTEDASVFLGALGAHKKSNPADSGGRWPANVIHSGCPEVLAAFAAFGESKSKSGGKAGKTVLGVMNDDGWQPKALSRGGHDDAGSPARFFYSAKASRADRAGSSHPTVKPISLMRYLCKLVTPPGGTVLDPFAGSGTTLQAALEEGFHAIGIEREDEYFQDCKRRLGIVDPTPEDDIDAFLAELVA
jgi:hypothetical protein